ncbi:hypothetical protein F7725_004415, partial [Dissostichus mawsoni]
RRHGKITTESYYCFDSPVSFAAETLFLRGREMSRKPKDEYYRFFTVTDPRAHEKGHTEYKVSARFVSKRHPEDVKEVVVWRRFSELKKLHGELAYTHRNLFRKEEEFPSFPRAQVFGRFDEAVIEERRKATEAMLLFTTSIPALYNSPQLKDFFRRRASDCEPAEEEEGREAPTLPQDLGTNLSLEVGEPEVAAEAYSEMGGSPREEPEPEQEELSDTELDDIIPFPDPCQDEIPLSPESQEEFDSLFDSVAEDLASSPKEEGPPPLTDNDLAVFDPCYKQDKSNSCSDYSDLFSLPPTSLDGGDVGYLNQAATELTAAMELEKEGEFSSAIRRYRTAVDTLITGVKGDPDPIRRESVMRRTAQYLKHTEMLMERWFHDLAILSLHMPTRCQLKSDRGKAHRSGHTSEELPLTSLELFSVTEMMDSPTDLFEDSSPQIHAFAPSLSSTDLPAPPSAGRPSPAFRPPGFPLIHHLLQPGGAPRRIGGQLNTNLRQQEDRNLEEGRGEVEQGTDGGDEGGMEGEDSLMGFKKRHSDAALAAEWSQDVLKVKRMKLESRPKGGEAEEGGRRREGGREGRRREREELKEQLDEARERLQALQEKVWRAFGEKHMAEEEEKKGRCRNREDGGEDAGLMEEEEDITEGMYDEEDIEGGDMEKEAFSLLSVSPFDSFHKQREERQKDGEGRMEKGRGLHLEGVMEEAGLWLDCGGLVRGDWHGGVEDEGEEGGQKFAQALKVELGSAVARVIDRVLRLYTEMTDPSSPPAAISFLPRETMAGGRGGCGWDC